MQLTPKKLNMSSGGPLIVVLNEKDANELKVHAFDRIKIINKNKTIYTLLDTSSDIPKGKIGLFNETYEKLNIKNKIQIFPANPPASIIAIKHKLDKKELTKQEIDSIIKDLTSNNLLEVEIAYFVAACYNNKLTDKEVMYLTKATVKEGKKLKLNKKIIADKHCIGGVPNNRTTMLITPIVAAAGITMPKTSSRSITSPSGTADTMEVLSEISFDINQMKKIIKKTNACMVWNEGMEVTGADSKLIKIRHPLRLDPPGLMIASILAKKHAVGATHLLIDIPIGKTAKVKTKKEAKILKKRFEKISRILKIKIKVIITEAKQPIGNGIGPALEARDVLRILQRKKGAPKDLEKKAIMMADRIFKLTNTKASAEEILNIGKAYEKFKEIIKAQKGNPNIKSEKIKLGKYTYDFKSTKDGKIKEINNKKISNLARIAGAPENKGAGIYLHKKLNEKIKKGDILLTIYAENLEKLSYAKREKREIFKIT
jgi:AMP phosphorylase